MTSPTSTSREGRALYICRQIATVGIVVFVLMLSGVIMFGWHSYSLNYPDQITGTVPSGFLVIVARTATSKDGMASTELVFWEEWESRQRQHAAYAWVENGAGEGLQDVNSSGRRLFYKFRVTELTPQGYTVDVTASAPDGNAKWIKAQYRIEGAQVIPLTFGIVTDAAMAAGVMPMALVAAMSCCWSLRAFLRWYTRYTGGNVEIWQLMRYYDPSIRQPYSLSLLVGYYLFLGGRRAMRLAWQRREPGVE